MSSGSHYRAPRRTHLLRLLPRFPSSKPTAPDHNATTRDRLAAASMENRGLRRQVAELSARVDMLTKNEEMRGVGNGGKRERCLSAPEQSGDAWKRQEAEGSDEESNMEGKGRKNIVRGSANGVVPRNAASQLKVESEKGRLGRNSGEREPVEVRNAEWQVRERQLQEKKGEEGQEVARRMTGVGRDRDRTSTTKEDEDIMQYETIAQGTTEKLTGGNLMQNVEADRQTADDLEDGNEDMRNHDTHSRDSKVSTTEETGAKDEFKPDESTKTLEASENETVENAGLCDAQEEAEAGREVEMRLAQEEKDKGAGKTQPSSGGLTEILTVGTKRARGGSASGSTMVEVEWRNELWAEDGSGGLWRRASRDMTSESGVLEGLELGKLRAEMLLRRSEAENARLRRAMEDMERQLELSRQQKSEEREERARERKGLERRILEIRNENLRLSAEVRRLRGRERDMVETLRGVVKGVEEKLGLMEDGGRGGEKEVKDGGKEASVVTFGW